MIEIRQEQPGDAAAIREVNGRAFGQDVEGRIVDALRANGGVVLSLVAAIDDRVVGHVIYSPAVVGDVIGAALGPMAVTPDFQRHGIGSRLVEAAHQHLKRADCPFIVVVGHPAFYPRFGFKPASSYGMTCEWPVPDETFMALVLDEARMQGVMGMAKYRAEFSEAS